MGVWDRLAAQFANPSGLLGALAGRIMARSNRNINAWTIDQLQIQPLDQVLEIGHGPGVGLKIVLGKIEGGHVVGLDPSDVMAKQAARLNQAAIQAGKLTLLQTRVEDIAEVDRIFTKVYAVNTIMFWEHPIQTLRILRSKMADHGRIALTVQPRERGANQDTVDRMARQLQEYLQQAGFREIHIHVLPLQPVNAVCVTGSKPAD